MLGCQFGVLDPDLRESRSLMRW